MLATTAIFLVTIVSAWTNASAQTTGYHDFSFSNKDGLSAPTGSKPESKVWFNDNSWWAIMFNPALHATDIYKLDLDTQTWHDTGTEVDDRPTAKGDALWDQASGKLYIVSNIHVDSATPTSSSSNWGRLYRYTYLTGTGIYSLDSGFPVTVTKGKEETLVIAKDSTGLLWVTYVESSKVMINHSNGNDNVWGTPFVLPISSTSRSTESDDISTIIAFGGNKIGVFWSNQKTKNDYFSIHQDGAADTAWSAEEIAIGSGVNCTGACADDHINIKADSTGKLYVASKTSFTNDSQPLINLLVRSTTGTWSRTTYSTHQYTNTRGIVLLDEPHNRLYFFVSSHEGGGNIDYKVTSMSSPSFVDGNGDLFIDNSKDTHINNATSTKQNITSNSGLLVLASDDDSNFYLHNSTTPSSSNPPTIISFTPTSGFSGTSVVITGKAFDEASSVQFNGADASSFTVSSSTKITAIVSDQASTGPISVTTPGGTGTSSSTFTVALAQSNPVPLVDQPLAPMTVAPGGPDFTVTLNGTGFVFGAVVTWDGAPLATQFVSSSQLTATVLSANIAIPQTGKVRVTNPTPAGGVSNTLFLTVSAPTTLKFASIPLPQTIDANGTAIAQDVNQDGKLDLIFLTFFPTNDYFVHVLLGNGDGTFQPDKVSLGLQTLALGDFNGDGNLDLAGMYNFTIFTNWHVLLGDGGGTFADAGPEPPVSYPAWNLIAGDFNQDGKLDAAMTVNGLGIQAFPGKGDGTFDNGLTQTPDPLFYLGGVGDYDADGKLDVIGVNAQLRWFKGNGDGTFQTPSASYSVDSTVGTLVAADVNGDNKLDVIAARPFGSVFTLFRGNGDGTFQTGVIFPYGGGSVVGDFNADGKLDIVGGNEANPFVLPGNGDGTFQSPVTLPYIPVTAGDFNNDGKMDFVAFAPSDGELVLMIQEQSPVILSPPHLTFDSQDIGTVSPAKSVTLTNGGATALDISNIAMVAASSAEFSQTNNCPASLTVGASCTIEVTFNPTGLNTRLGSLAITDSAIGSPQLVTLTGTGAGFLLGPGGDSTATISAGQTASYTIAMNAAGGFSQEVTLSCSGAPAGATCAVSPSSVTPSGPTPVMATVTVTTTVSSAGLIRPASGWSSGIVVGLAISGLGIPMLITMGGRRSQCRWRLLGVLGIVCLFSLGTMSACGGGSSGVGGGGVQAGSYSLTVTASSTSGSKTLTSAINVTLIVK